ncbi:LysR family transcriptional regulator [Thalassotalea sp. LPB0316]|uniref:LysR family transcriptional regulator n=1 Tax=Thalassotalea sp. LPB0316 TaxID=2769490 RepID=UPI001868AA50|nr:LysR family transcriptional regulator [Thalassotalea sp. LPB0316]QOL25825.1 LysR family transcriptional regulator [Thalassotalea sp. LPB0316]
MKIDLNLFRVFEAIYCEGNISKAAAALNLSQPAVSHSLAKLRSHYDDQLFVRQGNEMRPTALTKKVIIEVRDALQKLEISLVQSRAFEPASSKKQCAISLHSSLEAYYLPPLIKQLSVEAPLLSLATNRTKRSELELKLASGDLDMAIDILLPVSDNILHTQLESDQLVVIARKNHPILQSALTLEDYLSISHILVSSRTSGPGIEDFELGRLGLQRKISLRCQHLLSACRVVVHSDLILTLPRNAAKLYQKVFDIAIFELPVSLPAIDVHLYWHRNVDKDPANQWLRNKMILSTTEGS